MRKFLTLFSLLLYFSTTTFGFSQGSHPKIDSLVNVLKEENNKKKQIDLLNEISELEHSQGNSSKSHEYALKAERLAESINYAVGRAKAFLKIGILKREKGDIRAALDYFEKSSKYAKGNDALLYGEALTNIGYAYEAQNDFNNALLFYFEALEQNKKTNNKERIGVSYTNIAQVYSLQGNYINSILYFEEAFSIFEKKNDDWRIAYTAANLGEQYGRLSENASALKYFYIALDYYTKSNNQEGVSWANVLIGNVYSKTKEYQKAPEYYNKALEISERLNRRNDLKNINTSLGGYYFKQHEHETALEYYSKVLEMAEEDNDKFWLAMINNFIGQVYAEQEKTDEALEYFQKSERFSTEISNDRGKYGSLRQLAHIYFKKGNYDLAHEHINKSIEYHLKTNEKNPLFDDYKLLSMINEKVGDYESALKHYKLFKIYSDSLKQDDASRIAMKYEFERREAENEIKKNKEIQRKNTIAYTVYIILGLMVLSATGMIYTFRLRNKKLKAEKQNLELKQKETELAKETEEFKSRFLSNISHEFRTPLTLINGHLEILNKDEDSKEKQRFKEMEYSGQRLLQLINQLLDLTKIEAGKYQLYFKKGNLLNEVQTYLQAFHSSSKQRNINLHIQISETAKSKLKSQNFLYSSEALASIINNLISNALKFTPEGGEVECSIDFTQNKLHISVKDNGLGIPPKELPHIFNRFHQAQHNEKPIYEGSGIGLAIVKELAQLHGGDATVKNNTDSGCTFTVWISEGKTNKDSVEDSTLSISLSNNSNEKTPMEFTNENKALILVVEDQLELRKFIVNNLGEEFQFLEAENGSKGIELATNHIPDIIISDVMMPETDGYQLTKLVKENEVTSHIPVILLTAKAGQTDKIEGLTFGADDYIVKPFSISELKLRVNNRLKQQENFRKKIINDPYFLKKENTDKLNLLDQKFIKKLETVVKEEMEEEIDVSFLADKIGLSNSQLTRKLKTLIGVTPANFIKNIKLNFALDLLRNGYSVSETSWKIGFTDPAYFSKVFKKHFGFSPSEKGQF